MKFNGTKIPKFASLKDGSLIRVYCVCAQGEAICRGLGVSLGMHLCPPVCWVTAWVGAGDAKCLWLAESTFT